MKKIYAIIHANYYNMCQQHQPKVNFEDGYYSTDTVPIP